MAVRAAPLVGRDRELATLDERLAAAGDGSPGMVVVAGDAGVGKTRFVREVADRAALDGWTVLSGSCVELSEGAAVLAPVAEVLRQLARERGDDAVMALLDGPARWLAPLVPELEIDDAGGSDAPVTQVLVSFHRLLRDVADEGPVVLVLEDLHWADATTRDLLRHLATRLRDEQLLVVATVRTDDLDRRHPLRPVLAEVVRSPEVDRVDLGPLADDDLATHLGELAGGENNRADLAAIVGRSGGNPFHAEELLAAGTDRLPPSLDDALRLRLDRLPGDAQQLLGEAAVLGADLDPRLVAALTTLDRSAMQAALRAALDDGVLVVEGDGYAFRHALLREVALDCLLPDERIRAHAAAAAALEADPDRAVVGRAGAWGQAAHHWWEARDLGRCLVASVAAAGEAERVFASGVQLRHIERVMELWDGMENPEALTGTTRAAVLVTAAWAAEASEDPRAAEFGLAAVRTADAAGDGTARAEAVTRLVLALINAGRLDDALRVASEERSRHAADDRTAARSLALTNHAAAVCCASEVPAQPWDLDTVATEFDEALAIAKECGDWFAEYRALGWIVQTVGLYLPDRYDEAVVQQQTLVERPDAEPWGNVVHAQQLMALQRRGEFDGAASSLHRLRAEMRASVMPRRVVHIDVSTSLLVATHLGSVDEVERNLDLVDLRDVGTFESAVTIIDASGDWLRWTGRADRALERVEYVVASRSSDLDHPFDVVVELAASLAATGASFGEVVARVGRPGLRYSEWIPAVPVARLVAGFAAAAGDGPVDEEPVAQLGELVEQVAAWVDWIRPDAPVRPWADHAVQWARAELAHLTATPDPDLWDPVVAYRDDRGHTPYAAVARLRRAAARATIDGGGSPACEDDLRAASEVFTELGLISLQDQAAALARRLRITLPDVAQGVDDEQVGGESNDVLPELTGREREVLSLVAEGWTNKKVGEHLFISPKTVSVHMSNAMRKLDVDSRTRAVAAAHRAGLLAAD